MITVKLFGLLRLDSGIREMELEAASVREVFEKLESTGKLTKKELKGCVILVNGKQANQRSKLFSGDTVTLLSPVAGG